MSRGRALITGASSGIGEALARRFAGNDFDLVLTARRTELLEALAADLGAAHPGGEVRVFPADLAAPEGIDALCENIGREDLAIDILVNNAGMMASSLFADLDEAQVMQTIALNITALTRLTHHFLPAMLQRKSGRILNLASVAAFHPAPGLDLYAATKAYVLSLTESLAENLRGTGVSITALCPGLTDTDMMDESIAAILPPFMISTPEEVAREGFDALMDRAVIRIPGDANRLALALAKHQPRWLVRGIGALAARMSSGRRGV